MSCQFANDDERRMFVMWVVRTAIKGVSPNDPPVSQDTLLGRTGLEHNAARRRKYYRIIRILVEERGCRLVGLSPASFTASGVDRVRHVTALVLAALRSA